MYNCTCEIALVASATGNLRREGRNGKKNGGCNVDIFSYCICNVEISVDFPQMSWERDMDEQLTPEAWATMQKLSSSVRHIYLILRFVNREIHDVHEIML